MLTRIDHISLLLFILVFTVSICVGVTASSQEFADAVVRLIPEAKVTVKPDAPVLPFPDQFSMKVLPQLIGTVPSTPLAAGISKMITHFRVLNTKNALHSRDLELPSKM